MRRAVSQAVHCVARGLSLAAMVLVLTVTLHGCFWATEPSNGDQPSAASRFWTLWNLAGTAESVVKATVVATDAVEEQVGDSTELVTDTTLLVQEYIKGSGPSSVIVRALGGETSDYSIIADGEPQFVPGEEVVVFVAHHGDGDPALAGRLGVVGAWEGKLTVVSGVVLEMGIDEEQLVDHIQAVLSGDSTAAEPAFVPQASSAPKGCQYLNYKWVTLPVNYYVNLGSLPSGAVNAAASTWNAVGSKFQLVARGTTTKKNTSRDGANVVYAGNFGSTAKPATTSVLVMTKADKTRYISECDVRVNTYYSWCWCSSAKSLDLQSGMTHEFGHWVAFGDLTSSKESEMTMYWAMSNGETKKMTLEPSETAGLLMVYGKK